MDKKLELVVQALQERIGSIVSQYETHVAVLRAEITELTMKIQNMEAPKEETEE
jgi:phage host-nuclease inhibitor protein Gam